MKSLLASLLTLSLLAACGTVSPPAPDPAPTPTATPDWSDLAPFRDGLADASILATMQGASVYHLEFVIDETLARVDGKEAVRYTNRETVPLNEIRFRLFPNLLGGEMKVGNLR